MERFTKRSFLDIWQGSEYIHAFKEYTNQRKFRVLLNLNQFVVYAVRKSVRV